MVQLTGNVIANVNAVGMEETVALYRVSLPWPDIDLALHSEADGGNWKHTGSLAIKRKMGFSLSLSLLHWREEKFFNR
jgi:hypothetical protein